MSSLSPPPSSFRRLTVILSPDSDKSVAGDEVVPVEDIGSYLNAVFGDDTGFAVFALGMNPRRNPKTGKYRHEYWSESHGLKIAFAWPDEAEQVCAAIKHCADEGDLHIVPYLRRSRARAKGDAVSLRLVHTDGDNGLDQEKIAALAELGAFVVGSGSPGNGHVYVPLDRVLSTAEHEALCKGLIAYLDGDKAKFNGNDLLRPVGAYNLKPTVFENSPARPVHWLVRPGGRRVDPEELARLLGVELTDEPAPKAKSPHAMRGNPSPPPAGAAIHPVQPFDLLRHREVRSALAKVSGDRSADTMAVVGACVRAGLTEANARWAVMRRQDLAGRLDERHDDDVARCWRRATDSKKERT
jgi:hypothetical protein